MAVKHGAIVGYELDSIEDGDEHPNTTSRFAERDSSSEALQDYPASFGCSINLDPLDGFHQQLSKLICSASVASMPPLINGGFTLQIPVITHVLSQVPACHTSPPFESESNKTAIYKKFEDRELGERVWIRNEQ